MFQEHGVCPMLFLTLFKIFLSEYIWMTLTIRITWRHRSCHRGRHAKIFRWTNLRPTTDVLQAIYGLTHNIGIGDKQKSCVMCVKFSKEWKTILHIVLLKFLWPLTNLPSKYCTYGLLDWKTSILLPARVVQTGKSCATVCMSTTLSKRPLLLWIFAF